MRLKIKVLLLFIILINILIISSNLSFASEDKADKIDKIDKKIYENLENKDEVRVVVKLKPPEEKQFGIQKSDSKIESEKKEVKQEIIEDIGEENIKHVFEINYTFSSYSRYRF